MSNLRAMAFALLAIVTVASCAAGRGSEGTRREPPRVVDPTAGTVTYKGRTIVFDEAADPPLLVIAGTSITVRRLINPPVNRYSTSAMTYADFDSLWGLARALVDTGAVRHIADR